MHKNKKITRSYGFFCFSPPVMLATFILEVCLALYVLFRYRMNIVTRLVTLTLACLAIFQLAEYNTCGSVGLHGITWSRVGYVAITLLPAMGLHLVYALAGKPAGRLVLFGYGLAALWSSMFMVAPQVFEGYKCGGNYVIFQLQQTTATLYYLYYYVLLLIGIGVAMRFSRQVSPKVRNALYYHILGYAAFMVPTSAVNLLYPATDAAKPSIMCGFAVVYALLLTKVIVPRIVSETLKTDRSVERQRS